MLPTSTKEKREEGGKVWRKVRLLIDPSLIELSRMTT